MSLRTQYEFLFVGRDEGSFVENYAYDLGEGGEHSGKIFINLEIQNNPADAERIGENIFDTLRKSFFADPEADGYVRFEAALKEVNKELKTLRSESRSEYLGEMHVLIAAIVGNNLYLTQCGEAESYLIRRRYCSIISEDLNDAESKDIFTNIAHGTLELDDFVLLSSTRLLRYIGKSDLVKILGVSSLVSGLGALRDYLATEVLGKIGFVAIKAVAAAPILSEQEQGKVVAHLRKEEEVEKNGVKQRKAVNVMFSNAVKVVSGTLSGLRDKVKASSMLSKGRTIRGSTGSEGSKWMLGNWSKDKILGALIVVVLVLTGGVWWLRNRADEQQKIDHFQAILNEVQEEVTSAETNATLDKQKAGEILNDAEQKALTVLNSGFYRAKANEMLQTVQLTRDKLDAVVRVQPKLLADLSLKRANVSALGLLGLKDMLYPFEYNALYPITLDKVSDPITIDENETVITGTTFDDKGSLLFFTKSGKVIEYDDNRMSFLQTADPAFHTGIAVMGYNNKFYILDPVSNQIWRYVRGREKFDVAEKYNVDGDLSKAVSFTIDSSVYVLNSDGTIVKLTRGNKEDIAIKKQPVKALSAPTKIFTQVGMAEIYVLEPSEHRVMAYFKDDKTGGLIYAAQYVFDDLNDVRDLYVNQDATKMFLMDGTKVYEVTL